MQVRILGSAAGGGVPQWNCRCDNCAAVRAGSPDVRPRTQSSVAVSADGRAWFLLNASPDVRQQVLALPELSPPEGRARGTAIVGCVLTDAELDHVAGLLLLREGPPVHITCTSTVREWLRSYLPLESILARFARPVWGELALDAVVELYLRNGTPSDLRVRAFAVDPHRPRYVRESALSAGPGSVIGLEVEDRRTGGRLVYAPCVGSLGTPLRRAVEDADCVLFDGTFWDEDELSRWSGIGSPTARQMGHLPVSGPEGSLDWLSELPARHRLYVHINNTNPMLNERGPEHRLVTGRGVRVGADGDSFDL
jgi:pyrroloquinoline quinone biosynthesis protein B